jgi:hypothetical protein
MPVMKGIAQRPCKGFRMKKLLRIQHYVMPAVVALACCFSIWAKVQPKPQAKPSPDPAAAKAAAAAEAKRLDAIKQAEEPARTKKKKQLAQLQVARRLSNDGSYVNSDATIATVLGETDDKDVIDEANRILAANHPTTRNLLGLSQQTLFKIAAWGIDIVLGIVVLIALYVLLRFARYVWSMGHRGTWRVDSIPDGNSSGLGDATVASLGNLSTLSEWSTAVPPLTSGLLKLERLQLPTAKLDLTPTPLDLSVALQDLNLEFGGISLKGIAGAGRGIRGWFDSTCPSIKGKITQSSSGLTLRLTSLGPDGRTNTITAAVAGTTSTSALGATVLTFRQEDIRNAAEAASYQILYLIAMKGSTPIEAEAADKLREGLNLLGQSIYDQNPKQLVSAYDAFRLARTRHANLFEAYLYEGIALDLLQQHDEAIARFEYLEDDKRVADIGLREKAAYNRAISLFRKYKQRDAKKAASILEKLMFNSQIKLMARAARASVIAQYPMYWREQPANGAQAADVLKAKNDRHPDMLKLINEVTIDKEHIERELAGAKSDRLTEPNENQRTEDVQLEWAIKSAWGTLYLNSAIYFYAEPYPDEAWKGKRQEYLRIAYNAFQECAMLITPGIEILTNLAKVCLELDRIQQGCSYLEQALKLNPSYEYAYYRLARVRAERKEIPQLLSVLRRCEQNLTPTIAGFVELFRKYDVLLHPSIPKPSAPQNSATKSKPGE